MSITVQHAFLSFFVSSRRRHTSGALVTGVQTCALPISAGRSARPRTGRRAGPQGTLMNAARRAEMFRRLRDGNPAPTTELRYTTPFELLVAVVLSAQATDVGVNKATAQLFPVSNTPHANLAPGEAGLREYLKNIGLTQ